MCKYKLNSFPDLCRSKLHSLPDLCKSKLNSLPDLCKSKLNSLLDLCKSKLNSLLDLCKSNLNSLPDLCKSNTLLHPSSKFPDVHCNLPPTFHFQGLFQSHLTWVQFHLACSPPYENNIFHLAWKNSRKSHEATVSINKVTLYESPIELTYYTWLSLNQVVLTWFKLNEVYLQSIQLCLQSLFLKITRIKVLWNWRKNIYGTFTICIKRIKFGFQIRNKYCIY